MTDEPQYYLTYVNDDGKFALGEDVVVKWNARGDFELSSPHISTSLYGGPDAALQNTKLGLIAPLAPIILHLEHLPRKTFITPQWRAPEPRSN